MTLSPGSPRTTVVSAPGKVLVAGGYLVLEPQYRGLVIATSSRFYCVVQDDEEAHETHKHGDVEDGVVEARDSVADDRRIDTDSALIVVRAGQFPAESSTWRYRLDLEGSSSPAAKEKHREQEKEPEKEQEKEQHPSNPSIILAPLDASKRNKFVEITLSRTIALAWEIMAADKAAGVGDNTGAARELLRRLRGSGRGCHLVMLADNDFYSQREQVSATIRFWVRI
jgi:phosphomevalonate kinase